MGIFGYLALAFIFCKLAGISAIATWSWMWVLSPFWAPLVIAVPALFVLVARRQREISYRSNWVFLGNDSKSPDVCRYVAVDEQPAKLAKALPVSLPGSSSQERFARGLKARSWHAGKRCAKPGRNLLQVAEPCPWPDMRHL